MYNCPREFPAYGKVIHDTHPYGRACSVAEIMKESSNIGSAQIAAEVGAVRQRAFLDKMGFLRKSEIELLEKTKPIQPRDWGPLDVMTIGFGHSLAVSPLHLASGYATLFNGGFYRPPTLLKVGKGHPVGKGHRVFSEETSYKLRSLLRLVVTEGTG
jgi:cell division protein FtsI (penicillin-binding protein 3)